jgi:hypothetical protein
MIQAVTMIAYNTVPAILRERKYPHFTGASDGLLGDSGPMARIVPPSDSSSRFDSILATVLLMPMIPIFVTHILWAIIWPLLFVAMTSFSVLGGKRSSSTKLLVSLQRLWLAHLELLVFVSFCCNFFWLRLRHCLDPYDDRLARAVHYNWFRKNDVLGGSSLPICGCADGHTGDHGVHIQQVRPLWLGL